MCHAELAIPPPPPPPPTTHTHTHTTTSATTTTTHQQQQQESWGWLSNPDLRLHKSRISVNPAMFVIMITAMSAVLLCVLHLGTCSLGLGHSPTTARGMQTTARGLGSLANSPSRPNSGRANSGANRQSACLILGCWYSTVTSGGMMTTRATPAWPALPC